MKFTAAFLTALLSASAVSAAPQVQEKRESVSMATADPQWTIESMRRDCGSSDTKCTWTFGINTHLAPVTKCTYVVTGSPASHTNGGPANCGDYTITSGWNAQGFTVLSVVNNVQRKMVWPGYNDQQLAGGKTVKPDQSYPPSALP
jgi:hypothetical protein